jgi:hypothetical protein
MNATAGWENFYVIVGSSAGALIGLQFVVITLIAAMPVSDGVAEASSAFATPNVIHFCAALLLAAILTVPWHGIKSAATLWGVVGLGGVIYAGVTTRRMRTQTAYHPVLEDWLFHACLPLAAYVTLLVAAFAAQGGVRGSLFATAAASLLLLFIGIHNAWDSVTYHVFTVRRRRAKLGSHPAEHTDRNPRDASSAF